MVPTDEEARRGALAREIDSLTDRLISIRRDIHAHPEVGNEEHRTTALIVDELERAGLVAKVLPIGTGAYCDVLPNGTGYADGLLGIRADIDALPITDAKDVPYRSQNPGSATPADTTCTPPSCSGWAWCWPGCGRTTCCPAAYG